MGPEVRAVIVLSSFLNVDSCETVMYSNTLICRKYTLKHLVMMQQLTLKSFGENAICVVLQTFL